MGNATQVITVKLPRGSYATVTGWAKGASGWKAAISADGRIGSNGVIDGMTRRQNTYTTPTGTYTITEGFGVESGGTSMPYTRVNSSHWWVEDPESAYYNSMHSAAGADFPLVETGDRGSEHLINYPPSTQRRWSSTSTAGRPLRDVEPEFSSTSTGTVRPRAVSRFRAPRWTGSWPGSNPDPIRRIAIG